MRIRLIALAVMALIGLTAFAPAPFTRNDRRRGHGGDVLDALQGTWSVTEKVRMGPNGTLMNYSTRQKLRIENDDWSFVSALAAKGGGGIARGKGGPARRAYKIVIDRKRLPVEFRLKRSADDDSDYMVGIVRVTGDTAKILYRLGSTFGGSNDEMPRNFDAVPEGWYSLTLSRD
jgi:hypothetical protein